MYKHVQRPRVSKNQIPSKRLVDYKHVPRITSISDTPAFLVDNS